ncbi:MAG: peptidoglycan-binding protein [Dehalococcoidales bacterium]|nr:peptidoglycan-binding protein [Dehalococcoidales bacterium]
MRSVLKTLAGGALFAVVLLGGVNVAYASSLTDAQIQAVLGLLQSFGVDSTTLANTEALLNSKAVIATASSTATCINLTENLYPDVTDALSDGQVSKLQQFLALDASVYPEGKVTGYFGPATLAAVQRWQRSHSIVSSGDLDTTGYGFVGPKTRAAMSCDSASTTASPAVQTPTITTSSTTPSIVTTTSTSTQQSCVAEGLYWYTVSCHPTQAPAGSCAASYAYCSIGAECSANGWYSCRGSCYGSVDACLGQAYLPPAVPVTIATTTSTSTTTSSSGSGVSVATTTTATTTPTAPANKDATAPIISYIQTNNITQTTAVVSWSTNEVSTSYVYYSQNASPLTSGTLSGTVTGNIKNHSITLSGLSAYSIYYYLVVSTDEALNTATSSTGHFQTLAEPVVTLTTRTITATAGTGGTISPGGSVVVTQGTNKTFTITPNTGYTISSVAVDGVNQGAISTYTFTNVQTTHTISATFAQITYAISVTQGANGTISPSTTAVVSGGGQVFTIAPANGYQITSVTVDGVNQGAVSAYIFANVTATHTISATFSDTTAPSTPTNLTAVTISTGKIYLTWTPSTDSVGVAGYKVYRNSAYLGLVSATTTYNDLNLSPSTTYTYTVAAYDVAGNMSPQSSSVSATTYASGTASQSCSLTVSVAPTTPAAQNISPGQSAVSLVKFNATPNCNGTLNSFAVSLLPMPSGYVNISALRLYNDTTSVQLGTTQTVTGASVNFTSVNIPFTANQALVLKAVGDVSSSAVNGLSVYGVFGGSSAVDGYGGTVGNNASGNMISGNTMTVVVSDTSPPTVPTGVSATAVSSSQINLSWNASTDNVGVAGYKMYRNGTLLDSVGAFTYTYNDTGLAGATSYSYTTAAYDAAGNVSSQSSLASATTQTPVVVCTEPYVFVKALATIGSNDGQVKEPRGITVDAQGNVYVADTSNHRIQKFDSNGNFVTKWGNTRGSGDGQFSAPVDVAVSAQGNVYVADNYNYRIQKFDSNGNFLAKWGTQGSGDGQFNSPNGIGVDSGGNVYVADYGNNRIQKFDSNGTFITKWGTQGSGDGQFNSPVDVAVDAQGNFYVADYGNNRIQKFDSNGNFLLQWGGVSAPAGIVIDSAGNVFVAEMSNNYRISKFNSSGVSISRWNNSSGSGGQLSGPWRVAVDAQGNVYVAEIFPTHRIVKFSACASFSVINKPNNTNTIAGFSRNLTIGSTGSDVKQLQTLLAREVGFATDLITGYFGRMTSSAVKKLQEKYGIIPMSGYFGELTRKALTASVSNW